MNDSEYPPELLAEARTKPGGWVYEIDPAYADLGNPAPMQLAGEFAGAAADVQGGT